MDYDIVIVGAGPSGLACGIEAARAGVRYLIIDKGGITDAIRRFPAGMTFFSTPERLELGRMPFTSVNVRPSRAETLEYYRQVADHFDLALQLHTRVTAIRRDAGGFAVETDRGIRRCRFVIVATGYFDHTNRLEVPGEGMAHVSHYYDEPYAYSRCRVAVIGGRNSAVETALDLHRHGARVTLIHRREGLGKSVKYWIQPDIENRIAEGAIAARFNRRVTAIRAGELTVEHVHNGATETIAADFVFALVGYRPDVELLGGAGVRFAPRNLIPEYDSETRESNVPGLYLAGSVACGCETYNIFIENGREHAAPILADIVARG